MKKLNFYFKVWDCLEWFGIVVE